MNNDSLRKKDVTKAFNTLPYIAFNYGFRNVYFFSPM